MQRNIYRCILNSKLVILGSDSRVEQIGLFGLRYFREEPKIYKSGNCLFSLTGFYNEILNSPKILNESLKDLPEINLAYLDSFSAVLSYRTKEYLTNLKHNNIDMFNKMTAAGGHVFDLVIAGKNKNIPFCAIMYIIVNDLEEMKLRYEYKYNEASQFKNDDFRLSTLGSNKSIRQYLKDNPNFDGKDSSIFINELIKIECTNSPEKVGEPINILEIRSDTTFWVKRTFNCPNIIR